jgi:hypothetical protein
MRLPNRGLWSGGLDRRGLSKFWRDLDTEKMPFQGHFNQITDNTASGIIQRIGEVLVLGKRKENINEGGVTNR